MLLTPRVDLAVDRLLVHDEGSHVHLLKFVREPVRGKQFIDDELTIDCKPSDVLRCTVDEVRRYIGEDLIIQDSLVTLLPVGEDLRALADLLGGEAREANLENAVLNQ